MLLCSRGRHLFGCFPLEPSAHGHRKNRPACLARWQREVRAGHETRITALSKHDLLVLKPFSLFLSPGLLRMKIMARDQGLDAFPASACEAKILPASERLVRASSLQRFPTLSRHFPRFPTISRPPSPPQKIKCPRARRQPGQRLHGCIESPRKRPRPACPAGWRGEEGPGHESRPLWFTGRQTFLLERLACISHHAARRSA